MWRCGRRGRVCGGVAWGGSVCEGVAWGGRVCGGVALGVQYVEVWHWG